MAAANSDLFRKLARRFVAQVGAGGIADNVGTTGPLSSTTGLPTDTAVDITFGRVDADGVATPTVEETVTGVVSGSNLTDMVREQEGTAQAHAAGVVAENLINAITWNDAIDGILEEHNQDGTHGAVTATTIDIGSSVVVDETLDENDMASDSDTALATQQSIKAYVDNSISAAVESDGWITISDTLTYASASTFTISGVDRTTTYTKGTKLKLTQTTAKYFYVASSTFSTNTTVTVVATEEYTLADAAITSPSYSYHDNPQGFPTGFTYKPTWTGGTNTPAAQYFNISGGVCTIYFGLDFVASNAAGLTCNAPIASFNNTSYWTGILSIYDNGSWQSAVGVYGVTANSTTINFGKTISTFGAWAFAGFTASGNKGIQGVVEYRI